MSGTERTEFAPNVGSKGISPKIDQGRVQEVPGQFAPGIFYIEGSDQVRAEIVDKIRQIQAGRY